MNYVIEEDGRRVHIFMHAVHPWTRIMQMTIANEKLALRREKKNASQMQAETELRAQVLIKQLFTTARHRKRK